MEAFRYRDNFKLFLLFLKSLNKHFSQYFTVEFFHFKHKAKVKRKVKEKQKNAVK